MAICQELITPVSKTTASEAIPWDLYMAAELSLFGIDCVIPVYNNVLFSTEANLGDPEALLKMPWNAARVLMYPGQRCSYYGKWVSKLMEEHELGRVKEAIAFLPAYTETEWFASLWEHSLCFITQRQTFIGIDLSWLRIPTVAVYLGNNWLEFGENFDLLGDLRMGAHRR